MATHSSILAWKIPWTEEPGGLQSIGSQESIGLQELDMTKHTHIKSIKKHSSKNTLQKKKKHYRLLEQCMEGSTEVFT